jgi:hypothetical protein
MRRFVVTRSFGAISLLAVLAALAVSACGSSVGLDQTRTTADAGSGSMTSGSGGMSSMGVSSGSSVPSVNGIKPVASQLLASTDWQGMRIQARTMTPTEFLTYKGPATGTGTWTEVKPPKGSSFHLMVMLSDARTNEVIPYATVWVTIKRAGNVVYDSQQWPMISEYMGFHYGNNITLPGAGHYTMRIVINPPLIDRHVEYRDIWLKAHAVNVAFNWSPTK